MDGKSRSCGQMSCIRMHLPLFDRQKLEVPEERREGSDHSQSGASKIKIWKIRYIPLTCCLFELTVRKSMALVSQIEAIMMTQHHVYSDYCQRLRHYPGMVIPMTR